MVRRGAYAKGRAKREEILDAALGVIATRGYRGASVREIAEAAGLSPTGLLHYFGSKEELFVAILEARDARDAQEARHRRETRAAAEARSAGAAPGDDLLAGLLAVVERNAAVPGLVQLYAQLAAEAADPGHPAHAFFRERTAGLEGRAVAEIAEAQRAGAIRADLDPEWIVRSLHALADGLQSAWLLDRRIDMTADLERFVRLLAPGA